MKKRALPLREGRVLRLCAVFTLLFRLALVRDRGLRGGYRFGVAEVVVLYGLQLVVQFVDERHSGRDVELDYVLLRYAVEVLYERAEAVAVRGDYYAPAAADVGGYDVLPVGDDARDGVFEALAERELVRRYVRVARFVSGPAFVALLKERRARRIAAASDFYLRVAVLRRGLGLVESLQRAVVAFVELP